MYSMYTNITYNNKLVNITKTIITIINYYYIYMYV